MTYCSAQIKSTKSTLLHFNLTAQTKDSLLPPCIFKSSLLFSNNLDKHSITPRTEVLSFDYSPFNSPFSYLAFHLAVSIKLI